MNQTGTLTGNLLPPGDRVRLRAPELSDVDSMYAWENDPQLWDVSLTFVPFSRLQIEQFVLNGQHELFASRQVRLMIERIDAGGVPAVIGALDLFDYDPVHRRAAVGILVTEPYRGQGYGAEALRIGIRYAFGTLRLHQVHCSILADNAASLAMFEKIGFVRCGMRKDWIIGAGGWRNEVLLQLIPDHEVVPGS